MEARKRMSLAFKAVLIPAAKVPTAGSRESRLNIAVVFTSVEATIAALRTAGELADRLGGRITIVVPQIVPFPAPLSTPPVLLDWNERRFRTIATESPVETIVHIYLCRDRLETLNNVLAPGSLVVIGGVKRWWPTQEKRLARQLRRRGHEVVFTRTE
jgi:hypothetical protein